jgi:hypothetical protein
LSFSTRLEGRNLQRFKKGTSDAEKFSVSFYVKANANATYVCELYDYDSFRHVNQTFSVTTSWTRVELTFPADTTGELDNDSNLSLAINIYLHAGSNFTGGTLQSTWGTGYRATGTDNFFDSTDRTLFLTGVQLEVGDNATPFEHLTFGEELVLCQRYFHKANLPMVATSFYAAGAYSTSLAVGYPFPNEMRAAPTATHSYTNRDNTASLGTQAFTGALTSHGCRLGGTNSLAAYPYAYWDLTSSFDAEI